MTKVFSGFFNPASLKTGQSETPSDGLTSGTHAASDVAVRSSSDGSTVLFSGAAATAVPLRGLIRSGRYRVISRVETDFSHPINPYRIEFSASVPGHGVIRACAWCEHSWFRSLGSVDHLAQVGNDKLKGAAAAELFHELRLALEFQLRKGMLETYVKHRWLGGIWQGEMP